MIQIRNPSLDSTRNTVSLRHRAKGRSRSQHHLRARGRPAWWQQVPHLRLHQPDPQAHQSSRTLFHLEVHSDFNADNIVEKVHVLLHLIHLHSSTDALLDVTFIRAPSNALLKVEIPLVFRGDDVSPGLKKVHI